MNMKAYDLDLDEFELEEKSQRKRDAQEDMSGEGLVIASEWAKAGQDYHPRTRADKVSKLAPGVYSWKVDQFGKWWLHKESNRFEFGFKVYDANKEIIDRIVKYWNKVGGSLGVLMNGTRGSGKSMCVQQLANRLIKERQVPVLVVHVPIPLQIVLASIQQDMVIVFDEFEKTHDDEHQQMLLSVVDGMSRSKHDRLFLFTTNVANINESFQDRPSRIRYCFEFDRAPDEIIDGLIRDMLPERLQHFKQSIYDYLETRKVCTIDVVKAVISETEIFEADPSTFEDVLNIAKGEPPSFTIEIVDKNDMVVKTFSYYFKLPRSRSAYAPMLVGSKTAIKSYIQNNQQVYIQDSYSGETIIILDKDPSDNVWLAHLCSRKSKTPWKDFKIAEEMSLWWDERPSNWSFPYHPDDEKDAKKREEIESIWDDCERAGTVHGTDKKATFRIRITPNRDSGPIRNYEAYQAYDFD